MVERLTNKRLIVDPNTCIKMPRLSKEELKKVRKALPEDGIDQISALTGLKASTVKQILFKPERFRKDVIAKAVELGEKNAAEINLIISRVSEL